MGNGDFSAPYFLTSFTSENDFVCLSKMREENLSHKSHLFHFELEGKKRWNEKKIRKTLASLLNCVKHKKFSMKFSTSNLNKEIK